MSKDFRLIFKQSIWDDNFTLYDYGHNIYNTIPPKKKMEKMEKWIKWINGKMFTYATNGKMEKSRGKWRNNKNSCGWFYGSQVSENVLFNTLLLKCVSFFDG